MEGGFLLMWLLISQFFIDWSWHDNRRSANVSFANRQTSR